MRLAWRQRAAIGIAIVLIAVFMGLETERVDVAHTNFASLNWYGITIAAGPETLIRLGEWKYALVAATVLVSLVVILTAKKKQP